MARQESAREDLLAEATALVERAEFLIPSEWEPFVIGFRSGGAASIYFGQDEAYHFDSSDRLRRAYILGRIYKADGGQLASLDRQRTAAEVQLVRHDQDDAETAQFLNQLARRIIMLKTGFSSGAVQWLREVPEGGGVRERIAGWVINGLTDRIEIARSARVR